jgi:hypothetical protein
MSGSGGSEPTRRGDGDGVDDGGGHFLIHRTSTNSLLPSQHNVSPGQIDRRLALHWNWAFQTSCNFSFIFIKCLLFSGRALDTMDLAYLADSAPDAGKGQFHSFFRTAASRPAGLPRGAWGVAQGRDRPRPLTYLRTNGALLLCRHRHIHHLAHLPLPAMAGHDDSAEARIGCPGSSRRAVQEVQGHCSTPGARPSTMTSEPRGISGSGGSEPTRRGDGDILQ